MMDIHQTYCGNHFIMYVRKIIMPYTLNLHSAVWQLHLNKTGRKKKKVQQSRNSEREVTITFLQKTSTADLIRKVRQSYLNYKR